MAMTLDKLGNIFGQIKLRCSEKSIAAIARLLRISIKHNAQNAIFGKIFCESAFPTHAE